MRTLSFLFWTACSIGLGIWMATVPVGGRTPWDHAKRAWTNTGMALPEAKDLARLIPKDGKAAPSPQITEHHTKDERDAVNRLIARSASK
jgi:hypothetical protein